MVPVSPHFTILTEYTNGLDGMYGNFAGRDASRGMAKQSFDEGEPFLRVSSKSNGRHAQRYQQASRRPGRSKQFRNVSFRDLVPELS